MTATITVDAYRQALLAMVNETFEEVRGIYLDKGTSLFETLETISTEEASRPVSATCACIAAQVEHTSFYLEVTVRFARGEEVGEIDWDGSWQLTSVTDDEWQALKGRLRDAYQQIRTLMDDDATFENESAIGGSMAVVIHTAFHLGQIRQALCTVEQ